MVVKCELVSFLFETRADDSSVDFISYSLRDLEFVESHLKDHPDCSYSVMTSGTTGPAKKVQVGMKKLWDRSGIDPRDLSWFVSYPIESMGFLQVQVHSIKNGHSYSRNLSPKCSGLATTPSLFKRMLMSNELAGLRLEQISFGGEVADQKVLDVAAHSFPGIKISHTYASSELGRVFSTSDRLEGFPLKQLNSNRNYELKIKGNELRAKKSGGSWIETGDLFRVEGERIIFLGRKNDSGNVGGTLVFPIFVTNLVKSIAGVEDARCWLEPNPITGNVVVCQVVAPGDQSETTQRIFSKTSLVLGRAYRPARIEYTSSIEISRSGKSQ